MFPRNMIESCLYDLFILHIILILFIYIYLLLVTLLASNMYYDLTECNYNTKTSWLQVGGIEGYNNALNVIFEDLQWHTKMLEKQTFIVSEKFSGRWVLLQLRMKPTFVVLWQKPYSDFEHDYPRMFYLLIKSNMMKYGIALSRWYHVQCCRIP